MSTKIIYFIEHQHIEDMSILEKGLVATQPEHTNFCILN